MSKPDNEIFNYTLFKEHDTIVVESCTGTGKSHAMLKEHVPKYLEENPHMKLLTLTNKRNLSDQHIDNYPSLEDYRALVGYPEGSLTCCLNSIRKLAPLSDNALQDYIVYIDEIDSFLKYTHNAKLEHMMRDVDEQLYRIIKHAHKVVVSDAIIRDNVYEFLKLRPAPITIRNSYQNFKGVPRQRVRDEREFYKMLLQHVEANDYFLFGCDSCRTVSKLYYDILEQHPDKEEQMILITGETKYKVHRASEQFKDKFVFYSPSITTATDFSIDSPQDVFIYIKGGTITSDDSFQQATRTRNIRKLYYYCEAKPQYPKYTSVQQIKELMHNSLIQCREINCISTSLCNYQDPITHEMCMHETITFNNWAYNELVKDTYNTNLLVHFENILDKQGFVADLPVGKPERLDKQTKKRQETDASYKRRAIFAIP